MNPAPYSDFAPSHRDAPAGTRLHAVDPATSITVSIYLTPRDIPSEIPIDRPTLATRRAVDHAEDIARLSDFAAAIDLAVAHIDPARRLIRLVGTASQVEAAFRTELSIYQDEGAPYIGRTGALQLPDDLHEIVQAVLGVDTRPAARPHHQRATAVTTSYRPDTVAQLYRFPTAATGAGRCIGLIELGGGFRRADTRAAFEAMGLPTPRVHAVSINGAHNTPTPDDGADAEVALDIQVAGGAAPGAIIAVYFTPNTDAGFTDAISAAVHDTTHAPVTLSISWGAPEPRWTAQAIAAMNSALQDATTLGIPVFVAAGDSLATDGLTDGKVHVDFPASSPHAIGCGGTRLSSADGRVTDEIVWNDGRSGTGGGISALFAIPAFQSAAKLPPSVSTGKPGRGVPDVAANASPETGYRIVVNGQSGVVGGTSAAAPLWAALAARLTQQAGHNLGAFLPTLYNHATTLRDITTGTNEPKGTALGYRATPGWNPCTGLGVPDGDALAAVL